MPEYTGMAAAYKLVQIKNLRAIFHEFNGSFGAGSGNSPVNFFPLAVNYDGTAITPPTVDISGKSNTPTTFGATLVDTPLFPGYQ